MMISSENAGKVKLKASFFVLLQRLEAVIPSPASFVGVGCFRDVVVLGVY